MPGWVSSETEKTIPDLLPAGVITSSTRLVVVNALYFHANWLTEFNPSATQTGPFTRLDGSVVQAPLMSNAPATSNFLQGTSYAAVELPYANQTTSMVVIVPRSGQFATVEQGLTADFVASIFAGLAPSPAGLTVTLPKFTIHSPTFSVSERLQALGMTDAFDAAKADFSAMVSPAAPGLWLSNVMQQAYVDVSESGTKASAATAGIVYQEDDGASSPALIANRPFFFVIRDVPSNTALFVGRVLDPTQ